MGIIFIGSQPIGHDCLEEIIRLKITVDAVFTFKPDVHEKWEKSVEDVAKKENIPTYFSEELTTDRIRELNPELIVVIGYRKIFPNEILKIPIHGVIGIHASLLPHLRGQAPLNWAIILNDKKAGATLFKMDDGIDTGDIIDQKEISIELGDTIIEVKNKIRIISVELITNNILKVLDGSCKISKQLENGTYGSARIPNDGKINWNDKTIKIHNLIRASEPSYPAFTYLDSKKLYILKSEMLNGKNQYFGTTGQVGMTFKDGSVMVITGDGVIKIKNVKLEEGEIQDAKFYLKSSKIRLG